MYIYNIHACIRIVICGFLIAYNICRLFKFKMRNVKDNYMT